MSRALTSTNRRAYQTAAGKVTAKNRPIEDRVRLRLP